MTNKPQLPGRPVQKVRILPAGSETSHSDAARDVQDDVRTEVTEIEKKDTRSRPGGRFRVK